MKINRIALFSVVSLFSVFASAKDLSESAYSNVTIQNKTGASVQSSGLYINTLASVAAAVKSCSSPAVLYNSGDAGGSFVSLIPFQNNQTIQISANYLYNMIFTAIFYANSQPSTLTPCALPGCTWTTDSAPVSWCIYLGAMSPRGGNTSSTAVVPPYSYPVNDTGYHYDLVSHYHYIGPITCDDTAMSCSVSSIQNQTFP